MSMSSCFTDPDQQRHFVFVKTSVGCGVNIVVFLVSRETKFHSLFSFPFFVSVGLNLSTPTFYFSKSADSEFAELVLTTAVVIINSTILLRINEI